MPDNVARITRIDYSNTNSSIAQITNTRTKTITAVVLANPKVASDHGDFVYGDCPGGFITGDTFPGGLGVWPESNTKNVVIVSVIFGDGTRLGKHQDGTRADRPEVTDEIMANRKGQAKAWADWKPKIEAFAALPTDDALKAFRESVGVAPDPPSLPHQTLRREGSPKFRI